MKNIQQIINLLLEEEMEHIKNNTFNVYFDLDGVLADFSGAVHANPSVKRAEKELQNSLKQKPELLKLHHDELKEFLKGQQLDPFLKKIKKAFNKYRGKLYAAAAEPGHFANLDLLPGAVDMVKFAKNLTGKLPDILTAPMGTIAQRCEEEKIEWVENHLSGLYNNFYCTQQKEEFANSKFNILIDDRPKYVDKFINSGGTAILHISPNKSISELKEIIETLKTL